MFRVLADSVCLQSIVSDTLKVLRAFTHFASLALQRMFLVLVVRVIML